MKRAWILALLLASLYLAAHAASPDKPLPKKKLPPQKKALYIKLPTRTNWGKLSQSPDGKQIIIRDHPVWEAIGYFRDDGKTVFLLWTLKSNGHDCPGVYDVDREKKELHGLWGYGGQVDVGEDGRLTGQTHGDVVHEVGPP